MFSLATSESCFRSVEVVLLILYLIVGVMVAVSEALGQSRGFFGSLLANLFAVVVFIPPAMLILNVFFGIGASLFLDGLRCVARWGVTLPNALEVLGGAVWFFGGVYGAFRLIRNR